MLVIIEKFERIIYAGLMIMLMIVLVAAMGELAWLLVTSLTNEPSYLLENHELVAVLGAFLLVLIGVELLDTIKSYFKENTIHFEVVIILAIIAIARKVILLDPASIDGFELMGIGILVIGLAGAYYLMKISGVTAVNVEKPAE
jgi:uncharacterized membrane protein (DUF373 family)